VGGILSARRNIDRAEGAHGGCPPQVLRDRRDWTMKRIARTILGAVTAGVITVAIAQSGTKPVDVESTKAGEEKAVNLCSTCHGPRGISTSPEFPILAAQRAGYLESQLEAFRAKTREEKIAHDFMWGIAYNLDDSMIRSVALYYATQPSPLPHPGDPAMVAKGKELFDKGVPERGIPACATCHGANAEGMANFPRLAGQHAKYVVNQINYIQSLVRKAPVMHGIVKDLTQEEMQALAVYVQSK
jgi:cytochrome c553